MLDTFIEILTFLSFLSAVSLCLGIIEFVAILSYGVPKSIEEHKNNLVMYRRNHKILAKAVVLSFVIAFFYIQIPRALYNYYVKGNKKATLSDPRGIFHL